MREFGERERLGPRIPVRMMINKLEVKCLSIQQADKHELEVRRNQIQKEKKAVEQTIQNYKVAEQRSIESGDGRTAISSRKVVEAQQEQRDRLVIEENAVMKRIQEYESNKLEAERLKPEIERLYSN